MSFLKSTSEFHHMKAVLKMQKEQKTLFMTLKKQWFDMILSGEKKEEYREIKEYWIERLAIDYQPGLRFEPKQFDVIRFKNGYGSNDPVMDVECLGIEIREGNPKWGAVPGDKYFVIKLGNILKRPR
jgi:hypothetical protein